MARRMFDTPVPEFRQIRVFGKYSVRISEGRRTIMTEIYYGFLQYLQANTGKLPQVRQQQIPYTIILLMIMLPVLVQDRNRCRALVSEIKNLRIP